MIAVNEILAGRAEQMDEQWKPIAGFEGKYEVSTFGRVRSLPRLMDGDRSRRIIGHRQESWRSKKVKRGNGRYPNNSRHAEVDHQGSVGCCYMATGELRGTLRRDKFDLPDDIEITIALLDGRVKDRIARAERPEGAREP
jgi:hypothetical protein